MLAAKACRILSACDIGLAAAFASLYNMPSASCALLEEFNCLRWDAFDDIGSVVEVAN